MKLTLTIKDRWWLHAWELPQDHPDKRPSLEKRFADMLWVPYRDMTVFMVGVNTPYAIEIRLLWLEVTVWRWFCPTVCVSWARTLPYKGGMMGDWAWWCWWQDKPFRRFLWWRYGQPDPRQR